MSLTAPVPATEKSAQHWSACQLQEHLVELRSHHLLVSGFVDNLASHEIRRALRAYCARVEELVDHLEGLHEDDCLVRPLQEGL